jgi:hypothetical protein
LICVRSKHFFNSHRVKLDCNMGIICIIWL